MKFKMASNVFQLEIAAALAGRRALVLRLGFTLLLGLPFVLVTMPVKIQVAGISVIMVFISFFGAAVTYVRRKTEGHLERLKMLPISNWIITGDMILAGALIDCVQMCPLLALFLITRDSPVAGVTVALKIAGLFIITVLLFNLLGIMLALIVKDNSEVHLLGALGSGLLAFISGLFPVSEKLQHAIDLTGAWNPLTVLGKTLVRVSEVQADAPNDSAVPWVIMIFIFLAIAGRRFLETGKKKR